MKKKKKNKEIFLSKTDDEISQQLYNVPFIISYKQSSCFLFISADYLYSSSLKIDSTDEKLWKCLSKRQRCDGKNENIDSFMFNVIDFLLQKVNRFGVFRGHPANS